ncbi:hypothetical protein EDD22DRAFT_848748 [Suillus occidentalis]|nr:hypothetical protein EDD22DRAFT_848748 [Suillus occidentalis]
MPCFQQKSLFPTVTDHDSDPFDNVLQLHPQEHNIREASFEQSNPAKKLMLFDVDGMLSPAHQLLRDLRKQIAIGFVGGSDLVKISQQLTGVGDFNGMNDITTPGAGNGLPLPTGLMIATITVYCNPAEAMGGILEADSYCLIAFLYVAFYLKVRPGWEWLGDALAILWVGVSMWGLTWMRAWMNNPTFNSELSRRETLLQVSLVVFVGTLISNAACFSLWPKSATGNLQLNMTKTLDLFATLLGMLTSTFLLEEPGQNTQGSRESFSGNLRSGTRLQFELTKAHSEGRLTLNRRSQTSGREHDPSGYRSPARKGRMTNGGSDMRSGTDEVLLQVAADMFSDVVDDLGPPMKALVGITTGTLFLLH